jgi:hypothetical protein
LLVPELLVPELLVPELLLPAAAIIIITDVPVLFFAIPLALLLVDLVVLELEDLFLFVEVFPELLDLLLLVEVFPELFEVELELPTLLIVMLFLFTVPFRATPRIFRVFSSAADIMQYKYYI